MHSSSTTLGIYACSTGYRQFQVSALQLYDSLETPSAAGFVALYYHIGCPVRAAEMVGRNSSLWVHKNNLLESDITNVVIRFGIA
jgi:hypothetical protein